MLAASFTFDTNQAILHGLVTVAKFDGKTPSLACATDGGKVFVHSPHSAATEPNMLNINKTITCLSGGRLNPEIEEDVLLIGGANSLRVYNVEANADLFYTEVSDGVNCGMIESFPVNGILTPLAIVGGNCSLLGYDKGGDNAFWTVAGDNITALGAAYIKNKKDLNILAGSEDYAIQIF
jgi:Bardet-Biedl syndrome 2 protein